MSKLAIGLLVFGVVTIVLAVVIGWAVVPKEIDKKVKQETRLINGSKTWDKWAEPHQNYSIYLSFYIFDIQNADEVENGIRPKFIERGPYVYRQKRFKNEIQQDGKPSKNTVRYREKKFYFFDKKRSDGNLENDRVDIINAPFVSVAHVARKRQNLLGYLGFLLLVNFFLFGEGLVRRNVSVRELLWDGFDVTLYTSNIFIKPHLPKEFDDGRFGVYKGENGTNSLQYNISTGVNSATDFGKINTYNNSEYLNFWQPNSECDKVKGSDGTIFPPFFKKSRKIDVFQAELCRPLRFEFEKEIKSVRDIKAYHYIVDQATMQDPREKEKNRCYCLEKELEECARTGAMSLEGCKSGAPILMTTPYFMYGHKQYQIESGLPEADPERHASSLVIEPNSGMLLQGNKRVQINLNIKVDGNVWVYSKLKKDIVFPLLWADEKALIHDEAADDLKSRLLKPLKITEIVRWVVVALGIVVIVGSVLFYIVQRRRNESDRIYILT